MELKTYWGIVRRWAWVIVATTLLALAVSLVGFALMPQAVSYQATIRLAVRPLPEPKTGSYYSYDEYYAYLASEYVNDDVIELVQGGMFLQAVQNRLDVKNGGKFAIPPTGSIKAKKAHRVLTITVTSATAEGALGLAQSSFDSLSEKSDTGLRYFSQLTAKEPLVSVIDPPAITAGPGTRGQLDLALRGIVGLMAGLALAFLLDYLDDSVRDARELELMGLAVLGELPAEKSRSRRRSPGRPAPAG